MPRRRKTRTVAASRHAPAKVPDGNEGSDMKVEDRNYKLEVLLKDFEVECSERLSALQEMQHNMIKKVELTLKVELMKLPMHVKNMKLSTFISKGGTANTADELPEFEKFQETLEAKLNAAKNLPSIAEEDDSINKSTKPVKKGRQTRKKALGVNESKNMPPPPSTSRTRRTRQATKTPAQGGASRTGWDTPLVTPKFNPILPKTPLTITKKGPGHERVTMTMTNTATGSPVATNEMAFLLPVGPDKTVMIGESEMDEETLQTIQRLRQKLLHLASQ